MKKVFSLILIGLMVLLVFTSCMNQAPKEYKITFRDKDDETTVVYVAGSKVSFPDEPLRDGLVFGGWYFNGFPYPNNFVVTGDIVLTAKWNAYLIVMENDDEYTRYLFTANTEIDNIPSPERDDCIFCGWYQEKELINVVSWPLTLNITTYIYISWIC